MRECAPTVLVWGAFEFLRGLRGPCPFSCPGLAAVPRWARERAWQQGESGAGALVPQSPVLWCQAPWEGPLDGHLGLGLAQRRQAVPNQWLSGEWRSRPR